MKLIITKSINQNLKQWEIGPSCDVVLEDASGGRRKINGSPLPYDEAVKRADGFAAGRNLEIVDESNNEDCKGGNFQMEFRLKNNTDYNNKWHYTDNEKAAWNLWLKIKPLPDAGNLYAAFFEQRCESCGEWQSLTVDYATCRCA